MAIDAEKILELRCGIIVGVVLDDIMEYTEEDINNDNSKSYYKLGNKTATSTYYEYFEAYINHLSEEYWDEIFSQQFKTKLRFFEHLDNTGNQWRMIGILYKYPIYGKENPYYISMHELEALKNTFLKLMLQDFGLTIDPNNIIIGQYIKKRHDNTTQDVKEEDINTD